MKERVKMEGTMHATNHGYKRLIIIIIIIIREIKKIWIYNPEINFNKNIEANYESNKTGDHNKKKIF